MMLSLPTTSTYIVTSALLLTVVMAQNDALMSWLLGSPEVSVEERAKKKAPRKQEDKMIAPRPKKVEAKLQKVPAPTRKEMQAPTKYNAAPRVSKSKKQEEPTPPRAKEKVNLAVKAELKIQDKLSKKEAADYTKSVAKGKRLMKGGIDTPPFDVVLGSGLIDSLQANGLIKLFVKNEKRQKGYVFSGGWSLPGKVWEAAPGDIVGFSYRLMTLEAGKGRILSRLVSKTFVFSASECEAFILFRSDIDAMILAAQDTAAQQVGAKLKDVEMTRGEFRTSDTGLPFNYKITSLSVGGKWFPVGGGGKATTRKG